MVDVIHAPPNEAPITKLYAFLSRDANGNEGICAAPWPGLGTVALVTATEANRDRFRVLAAQVAQKTGKTIIEAVFVRQVAA